MSYVYMDHAGWVESNIKAAKAEISTKKPRKDAYGATIGWHGAPDRLNEFEKRVFTILGIVGGGIYNAPISWKTVLWGDRFISLSWRDSLATFDFDRLTRLVFMCHDARIRLDIKPGNMSVLRLYFHRRGDIGRSVATHPSLSEAVAAYRGMVPLGHAIVRPPSVHEFDADLRTFAWC